MSHFWELSWAFRGKTRTEWEHWNILVVANHLRLVDGVSLCSPADLCLLYNEFHRTLICIWIPAGDISETFRANEHRTLEGCPCSNQRPSLNIVTLVQHRRTICLRISRMIRGKVGKTWSITEHAHRQNPLRSSRKASLWQSSVLHNSHLAVATNSLMRGYRNSNQPQPQQPCSVMTNPSSQPFRHPMLRYQSNAESDVTKPSTPRKYA